MLKTKKRAWMRIVSTLMAAVLLLSLWPETVLAEDVDINAETVQEEEADAAAEAASEEEADAAAETLPEEEDEVMPEPVADEAAQQLSVISRSLLILSIGSDLPTIPDFPSNSEFYIGGNGNYWVRGTDGELHDTGKKASDLLTGRLEAELSWKHNANAREFELYAEGYDNASGSVRPVIPGDTRARYEEYPGDTPGWAVVTTGERDQCTLWVNVIGTPAQQRLIDMANKLLKTKMVDHGMPEWDDMFRQVNTELKPLTGKDKTVPLYADGTSDENLKKQKLVTDAIDHAIFRLDDAYGDNTPADKACLDKEEEGMLLRGVADLTNDGTGMNLSALIAGRESAQISVEGMDQSWNPMGKSDPVKVPLTVGSIGKTFPGGGSAVAVKEWNLYEDAETHVFDVSGVSASKEAENKNAASSKYYDSSLSGNKLTVSLKDDADRKKAADANCFEFDLGSEGTVVYTLPVTYSKPSLKLSSSKGRVKAGKTWKLKTRVLQQTAGGSYAPCDLSGAEVSYGSASVTVGENGEVTIEASGKANDVIKISREGWNEKDPVTLKYTITEVKADKDLLELDMGSAKKVVLNSSISDQSFSFPLYLNGEAATAETVTIEKGKKGEDALGSVSDGKLTVSLGDSGLGKGKYTLKLTGGKAKCSVKVIVSDKPYTASGKIKAKMDAVTGQPMVVVPALKEVSGTITDVSVSAVTGSSYSASDFTAVMAGENIEVYYTGSADLKSSALKIGDMSFMVFFVDGSEGSEPLTAEFTVKNVKAKKSQVKLKAAGLKIPKDAVNDGSSVIGVVNLVATYKDAAKQVHSIAAVSVKLDCKKVEAETDPSDAGTILVKKLNGNSGTIKATMTFPGGVTKKVTIKVSKAK
ncbi:MAG: hypothetical protein IK115_05725 [Lachnospiraceae bacterium]|nr:hypothetical protein [Lachnospiraceae bacterium]